MSKYYFQDTPIKVTLDAGVKFAYCTCGLSETMPYCNGTHRGTEFKPIKWTPATNEELWLCRCGKSKNKPHCDGSHQA